MSGSPATSHRSRSATTRVAPSPRARRTLSAAATLTALAALAAQPATAQTGTTTVQSTANIFATAGNASAGDGTSPVQIALSTGTGRTLRLSNVTGSLGCNYNPAYNADGVDGSNNPCVGAAQISSLNRIGGLSLFGSAASGTPNGRSLALIGLFLGNTLPGSAPAGIAYGDASGQFSYSAASYAPFALGQAFYLGDGLTGVGTGPQQAFAVPDGATSLYLGFADACNFNGPPNCYYDNVGSLSVTYSVAAAAPSAVPEPGTWALMTVGLGGLGAVARRRARV